ncbi:MAG: lipid A biosynthesis lauroyl acyltransferase [Rhodobacteraceae bacterium HLUCCA12]|nr:MAG: lipid A biosynthesis lauroyl acyltransferase [Rhodobacteraceae bacterium HLUCCA12]
MTAQAAPTLRDRIEDGAVRAVIGVAMLLPYAARVRSFGWMAQHVLSPLSGGRRRIRANLAHVFPDLPRAEVDRLCGAVANNVGRAFIEMLSGPELARHVAGTPLEGPGAAAMEAAHAAGKPVVLVSGHLGNYDAARAVMLARGLRLGGLYAPMRNPLTNRRYVAAIERIGKPMFPRGREGMGAMLRFLRNGGILGMVIDQYMAHGAMLDFLGKPAPTALSAAEIALKYDAVVVPGYAIRQPDGLSFRIWFDAPVPHSDPVTMTQALNDSLAHHVRQNMDQWFWIHRRWFKD